MTPEVQAGAELLDRVHPGWFEKINVETLDLVECDRCVLGQLYGHFRKGVEAVGLPVTLYNMYVGAEYGFNVYGPACDCDALTPDWIEAINERLNPLTVNEILQSAELVTA